MSASKTHELRCWPEFFEAIRDGRKRFELRKDDRGFEVGDDLHLREWEPGAGEYTGRHLTVRVTYKMAGGEAWGLMNGYCILSIDEPRDGESGG